MIAIDLDMYAEHESERRLKDRECTHCPQTGCAKLPADLRNDLYGQVEVVKGSG